MVVEAMRSAGGRASERRREWEMRFRERGTRWCCCYCCCREIQWCTEAERRLLVRGSGGVGGDTTVVES